jgi:hypothetical protein
MAVKGGQLIHVGNGVTVIDRAQTIGPGQLNIPTQKIYEVGNYKSVTTIRAGAYAGRSVLAAVATTAADATVTVTGGALTSADVGRQVIITDPAGVVADFVSTIATVTDATHFEAADPAVDTLAGGDIRIATNGIDLTTAVPVDFASQWKRGKNDPTPFAVISSVAIPFLYLESLAYRFGLADNATQTATLRGDTIFYNPGPSFVETAVGSGSTGQTIITAHPAYQSADADGRRVLAVTVGTKRLTFGADYTETYGSVSGGAAVTTVHLSDTYQATDTLRIIYSSPDSVSYLQNVHPDTTVKPGAVRGRDIEIYVGGYDPADVEGSQVNKLTSVQSVQLTWQVTLDKDEEFGNHYAVGQDFDVPTVNGSVDIKPRDSDDFRKLLRLFTGVTDTTKVIGPSSAVPLALDVVIKDPDTQRVLKRLNVSDARFTLPGYSGQVQQKLTVTVPFESDEGDLLIFER